MTKPTADRWEGVRCTLGVIGLTVGTAVAGMGCGVAAYRGAPLAFLACMIAWGAGQVLLAGAVMRADRWANDGQYMTNTGVSDEAD